MNDAGASPSWAKPAVMLAGAFALGVLLCSVFVVGFVLGTSRSREVAASAKETSPTDAITSQETAPTQPTPAAETSPQAEPAPTTSGTSDSAVAVAAAPAAEENLASSEAATPPVEAAPRIAPPAPAPDPALPPGVRKWRDITGKFEVVAQFVSFDDKLVRLRTRDEKVVAVPIDRLSQEDQKFVLQQPPEASIDLPPPMHVASAPAGGEGFAPQPGGEGFAPQPGGEGFAPQPGGEGFAPQPGGEGFAPQPGGEEFAPQPGGDPSAPLFGNAPYNPPPRTTGRPRPRLNYPDAQPRTWTPYSHDPFVGVFHNLEAGRLSIRIHNGIVLSGPVNDMSPADLDYIRSMMGDELFRQESAAPPAAFGEPSQRIP